MIKFFFLLLGVFYFWVLFYFIVTNVWTDLVVVLFVIIWTGRSTYRASTATKIRQRRCQTLKCVSIKPSLPHGDCIMKLKKKKSNRYVTKKRKENVNILCKMDPVISDVRH